MLISSFCGKNNFLLLLAVSFLILSSCSKKGDDASNVTPIYVDYSKYPWIAYRSSNQDTIRIKNNELHLAFGARDFSNTRSLSSLSRFQPISGDFEMSLDYEKASNFFLTVIAHNEDNKNATVSVSDIYSGISWGSAYELDATTDFEASTSGTMTVKRTGQSLKVTIVKNYLSGSTPSQKTQEATCTNFFTGESTLTFSALPFSGSTVGVTMKRFSLTDTHKSIIDNFSSSDSLYVSIMH